MSAMANCSMEELRTPVYLIDEAALIRNLEILQGVQQRTGCHILLAQKAFSMFRVYPLIAHYLSGATASGLYEARLAHEELGGENHVFCPAYTDAEMAELCKICDHISFNSLRQLEHHRPVWQAAGVSVGLRVNPEHSTQEGHAIYDPCAPCSRLGIPAPRWEMPCRRASRAYIFTRCVNRMLRRWWRRLKRSRKSSGNFYTGCAG